ncbi:MAG: radical SAM protein [Holosporaceae bacterium]|nr:radical SAM protein [Holosporaceae bacterium]
MHWPFCLSKCPYCDFMSVVASESVYEDYEKFLLQDLKNELKNFPGRHIGSVFFGGGTPSLMSAKSVENMLNALRSQCILEADAEISLEANPGTFDRRKLLDFKNAGVNRLSIGIQSFQNENLKFLGRIYDEKQSRAAAEIVSGIFFNFSMDFIYGYQCQTPEDLRQDLIQAVDFGCRHLSCYQLTFEENTPFFRLLSAGVIKKSTRSTSWSATTSSTIFCRAEIFTATRFRTTPSAATSRVTISATGTTKIMSELVRARIVALASMAENTRWKKFRRPRSGVPP